MRQHSFDIEGFKHSGAVPAASRVGPLLASSIIVGFNDGTRDMPESAEEQVRNLFVFAGRILDVGGLTWGHVAKFNFFVSDGAFKSAIESEWVKRYPDPGSRPARHVLVSELPPTALVLCDFLAYGPES